MTDSKIRVMLVDDQELIRTGFRLVLMADPAIEVVGEAGDGSAALDLLAELGGACDVVLMDVRMPGMNGIDASAAIAERFPDTRVLVLTTFDLDEYATSAIQAGASGFLLKDARPSELIDAIRRVVAGDAVMAPSVTQRMLAQLRTSGQLQLGQPVPQGQPGAHGGQGAGSPVAGLSAPDSPGLPSADPASTAPASTEAAEHARALELLTEREREVLQLIAEGLNNAEISSTLFLSESTVKTHVGRVLAKLQLRDRVHAVIFARTAGM